MLQPLLSKLIKTALTKCDIQNHLEYEKPKAQVTPYELHYLNITPSLSSSLPRVRCVLTDAHHTDTLRLLHDFPPFKTTDRCDRRCGRDEPSA